MTRAQASSGSQRGFSLVELLVTIILAGIIFAAMIPMFASALKRTTGDNLRVTATNIAQDRLEKIRQLPYSQIVANSATPTATPNLYNPANTPFATTYTPVGSPKVYKINYFVDTYSYYKDVTVTVDWVGSGPNYQTKMDTIVMDPQALSAQSTSNPFSSPPGGYSLTVAFKNWTEVSSSGVVVTQVLTRPGTPTPIPTKTVIVSPTLRPASAATPTVMWTGLSGGTGINYTVTCNTNLNGNRAYTSPVFHLLSNGWMKFDTNPGGS